ncbi:MAG: DUF2946 family protein [Bauldia sp.]|jgi:hypothetical protein|nr:DUF2946 family protein [Bauldia sp.]
MAWRSRGGGLRLWAAILAVYALLLHAPAMAAMGHSVDGAVASTHDHGDPAGAAAAGADHDGHSSADKPCCLVCDGGPCAVGPVNSGVLALPLPLARARRLRLPQRARVPGAKRSSWFEARGPPSAV